MQQQQQKQQKKKLARLILVLADLTNVNFWSVGWTRQRKAKPSQAQPSQAKAENVIRSTGARTRCIEADRWLLDISLALSLYLVHFHSCSSPITNKYGTTIRNKV